MKGGGSILLLVTFFESVHGQQVQRSWVGFQEYYHEVPATAPHAVIDYICGQQDQYTIGVRIKTEDGTAKAGIDYVPLDTEVIFEAGSPTRSREIEVHLIQNTNVTDRTFTIKLSADFPGEVSQSRGTIPVTITAAPPLKFLPLSRFNTNLVMNWRASATNSQLQAAASLQGPWMTVTNKPSRGDTNAPNQHLAVPPAASAAFYRLSPVAPQ
jgi:hypothetical protein